jgi:hypothetical protein
MPGHLYIDNDEHRQPSNGTALTAGAVSTSAAGTISPTTSAGASPTVTFTSGVSCDDTAGAFELNPVTGGGAQAAGQVALVRFAKPYSKIPKAVVVTIYNHTDTTAAIVASSGSITAAGFDVLVGTALTTAKTYRVNYHVIP